MFNFGKNKVLTEKEMRINDLKEEIRNCEYLIKRAEQMYDMSTDENLIEARIYEIKSLVKHYDYLILKLKEISLEDTVNV